MEFAALVAADRGSAGTSHFFITGDRDVATSRARDRARVIAYILRRVLYAVPILLGVNLVTFALFFLVNTPDDMARLQLGAKRVTPEAIANWKREHGYDKPLVYNSAAAGAAKLTDTIFY